MKKNFLRKLAAVIAAGTMVFAAAVPAFAATETATGSWSSTKGVMSNDTSRYAIYPNGIILPKNGTLYVRAYGVSSSSSTYQSGTYFQIYKNHNGNLSVYANPGSYFSANQTIGYTMYKGTYYLAFGNSLYTFFQVKYSPASGSNTSKSRAKTASKGGSKKTSYFFFKKGKSLWFRVRQPRYGRLKVLVDGRGLHRYTGDGSSYGFSVACYYGSKKIGSTRKVYGANGSYFTVTNSTRYGKAKAGTYYFKVSKMSSKVNGKINFKVYK
ncbi:MAG: hypothetical protein ACI4LM_05660 [Anaerovoracaceae bacterium]